MRGGGAVSGRTENGGVVLSPDTGEHQARADRQRRTDEGAFKRKGVRSRSRSEGGGSGDGDGGRDRRRVGERERER